MTPTEALRDAESSFQRGDFSRAQKLLVGLLDSNYESSKVNELLGYIAGNSGDLDAALKHLQAACAYSHSSAEALYYLGKCYMQREEFSKAVRCYEKSIQKAGLYFEAIHDLATAQSHLGEYTVAHTNYLKAKSLNPKSHELFFNIGRLYEEQRKLTDALASYERAVELEPDYPEAWSNRGVVLSELKRHKEAVESFARSIKLKPNNAKAWGNRGNSLNDLKRYEEALSSYQQALKLKSDIDFWLGSLIQTQMKICDWTDLDSKLSSLQSGLEAEHKFSNLLPVLGSFDSPKLQQLAAKMYVKAKYQPSNQLGLIAKRPKDQKIRIGYFSMDFREHPVAQLTADLFELHDRNQFEVYAFSFGANSQDLMRQRLEKSFDKFLDVDHLSDIDIARLSRELKVDIGIDLGGHTKDSRPRIFSERAAPIQVNYLGYPGTWGHPCMDYFIGDKTTITDESRDYFSEKIIYMPHQFQANPISRLISEQQRKRTELGLTDDAIVFCCFNNNWKITPIMFESWMQILQRVPKSVLWLYAENQWASKNIVAKAGDYGISCDRLIFANRVPDIGDHLARYQLADFFLDTFPYGAHTTASDALWTGLPVLTLAGKSFASRVAASLLDTVGLPELITHSLEQYEALAVELANNPERIRALKDFLVQNRSATPLFDTPRFTKHLEAAYHAMYERYHANLPPDHIYVES
jgi:predicted O-linked N-acetylglucosamine transferase (SPINDLY family)